MASQYPDSVFCSPFLSVASLDVALADGESPIHVLRDPSDPPDITLIKKQDRAALRAWVERLKPDLRVLARDLMRGKSQADIARDQRVSEAAISKRVGRLIRSGRPALAALRASPLLA